MKRRRGAFPKAEVLKGEAPKPITVWCSNDYLGMGQHPEVLAAMHEAIDLVGAGSGGTRNIAGTTHYHVELERELADLHGKEMRAGLYVGIRCQRGSAFDARQLLPGCIDLLRREEPRVDDRRHSQRPRSEADLPT